MIKSTILRPLKKLSIHIISTIITSIFQIFPSKHPYFSSIVHLVISNNNHIMFSIHHYRYQNYPFSEKFSNL